MQKYLLLAVGAALVNNVVLVKILGICPVMGLSRRLEASFAMGMATAFTLTLVTAVSYWVSEYVLVPFELEYLRILSFILIIAACAAFTEIYIRKAQPLLRQTLGIYLPLSTINCAVLGVPLLSLQEKLRFVESLFFGFGSAVGFTLVLILFAAMRDRLEGANVPLAFRGMAIAMITAGLMSLGFMGFYGLVK